MMYKRHMIPLLALAALAWTAPMAGAGERNDPFLNGPQVGVPLRFAAANGGAFRPRQLVIHTAGGAIVATLPATSHSVRSEDRVDLREVPLIGKVFRERLAPSDARQGQAVGTVIRVGDVLHVEATGWPGRLGDFPVSVATTLPRQGSVSYRLGRLGYRAVTAAMPRGRTVGAAHILGGQLVIASPGNGRPGLRTLVGGGS